MVPLPVLLPNAAGSATSRARVNQHLVGTQGSAATWADECANDDAR